MNRRHAVFAAGGLALFTAIVHLVSGVIDLYDWLVRGGDASILPFAFVAFSLVVFCLCYTYAKGLLRESRAYAAAALVMVLPIVGYADWHAAGVTESALGLEDAGLGHDHGHGADGHGHDGDEHGHSHDDDHDHGDDHDHSHDDNHSHGDGDDHSHDDGNGHDHADDHEHTHDDGGVVDVTVDHLRDDAIALSIKLAELAAAALFAGLAVTER